MPRSATVYQFADVTWQNERDGCFLGELLQITLQAGRVEFAEAMQSGDRAGLKEIWH